MSFRDASPTELEDLSKSLMLYIFSFVGIGLFAVFAVVFALRGEIGQVIINVNIVLILAFIVVFAQTELIQKIKLQIGIIIIIFATMYLFVTAEEDVSRMFWILSIPPALYFLLRLKPALIINTLLLLFIFGFLFMPFSPAVPGYNVSAIYRTRFVLSYGVISILCLVYAAVRQEMHRRLMENREVLEKQNTELNSANEHVKLLHREMRSRPIMFAI